MLAKGFIAISSFHCYFAAISSLFKVVNGELMTPERCEIPKELRGEFFRQIHHPARGPDYLTRVPNFERLIFNKFAEFSWGRCARQVGPNSFLFSYRANGKSAVGGLLPNTTVPLCFRCFTLVQLTQNVIQSLHQNESICHKSLAAAAQSCFDPEKVSPGEGTLLFRHGTLKGAKRDEGCELLQGKFQFGYNLKLDHQQEMVQKFECKMDDGSEVSTCVDNFLTDEITFRFKNCTFPNFEQTFRCVGSWPIRREKVKNEADNVEEDGDHDGPAPPPRFVALFNIQTQEFRCGILLPHRDGMGLTLFLSVDSSCSRLTPNGQNALEEFTLREYASKHMEERFIRGIGNVAASNFSHPCEFPLWLLGRRFSNGLRIGRKRILHQPEIRANFEEDGQRRRRGGTGGMGQIASICLRQEGPERFLVHSAGKCGQALGYHCLWFRERSNAIVEFRTTGIQSTMDADICDSNQFLPWTALLDVGHVQPERVPCGIRGHFSTPKEQWLSGDCFFLEADCSRPNTLKLVAFQCQTSRVYEVSEYECLASWREGTHKNGYFLLFIYTRQLILENNSMLKPTNGLCIAIRASNGGAGPKGIVDLILLGKTCKRQIDWESDDVLALEKKENCGSHESSFSTSSIAHELENNLVLENFAATHQKVFRHAPLRKYYDPETIFQFPINGIGSDGIRIWNVLTILTTIIFIFLNFLD